MTDGIFGDLFDLNGDGKLDFFEQALEFDAFERMLEEESKDDCDSLDLFDDDCADDDDDLFGEDFDDDIFQ